MSERELNERHRRFVQEYLIDLNATQAAIRAGYSEATAGQQGHELLKNPKIQESLAEARAERSERTKIDQDWLLMRLAEVHARCMQATPVLDRKGNQVLIEGPDGSYVPAFTFEHAGANRALELIGKHVNIGAFRDRVEVTGKDGAPLDGMSDTERAAKAAGLLAAALKRKGEAES